MFRRPPDTLFLRAYDSARRAVHYLRAKPEEAESIAPSLYAGRGGSRRREEAAPPPPSGVTATPAGAAAAAAAAIPIENESALPITHPFGA